MDAVRNSLRKGFERAKPYVKVALAIMVGLVAVAAIVNGGLAIHDFSSAFNWAGNTGSIVMTAIGGFVSLLMIGGALYLKFSKKNPIEIILEKVRKKEFLQNPEVDLILKKLNNDEAIAYNNSRVGWIVTYKDDQGKILHYAYQEKNLEPVNVFDDNRDAIGKHTTHYTFWNHYLKPIEEVLARPNPESQSS